MKPIERFWMNKEMDKLTFFYMEKLAKNGLTRLATAEPNMGVRRL